MGKKGEGNECLWVTIKKFHTCAQTKEKQKRLAQNQMHHTLSFVPVYSGAFIYQCLFSLFPALFSLFLISNFISTKINGHALPPPGTRAARRRRSSIPARCSSSSASPGMTVVKFMCWY